jgi:hypothetical protein
MSKRSDDVLDVLHTIHQYFRCIDNKDWDGYGAIYEDRVVTDFAVLDDRVGFGSVAGEPITAQEIVEKTKANLDHIPVTQHMIMNTTITVNGDDAIVLFYEEALHYYPRLGPDPLINTWKMYGRVEQHYRRSAKGWKLHFARLTPVYDVGNRELLNLAGA